MWSSRKLDDSFSFDKLRKALYKKSMKTRFYIVRHGQTLFNLQGKIQGWSDSPLTDQGFEQARKMAEKLNSIDFDLGISSSSERARDTLYTIALDRFPCSFYKDLKEICFGSLEGDSVQKIIGSERTDWREFGGETFEQARLRVENCLISISKEVKDGNVLVVSHGAVLRELIHHLKNDFYDIMPNCSMVIVDCIDGKLELYALPEVLI